jgi:hypothetical protein
MTSWGLTELPLPIDFETKKVLKSLPAAHASLSELKGMATTANSIRIRRKCCWI